MEQITVPDIRLAVDHPESLDWKPLRPGIWIHRIYQVSPDGPSAAFLRYQPGATLPRHTHAGLEHIFVLAGSQQDERGVYEAGSMTVNPPGTSHNVSSPNGCIVLVLWERPVIFETGQSY
jgi:anti-sigma factor ChrR (cupin superfamily)